MKKRIQNLDALKIRDEETGSVYYGCDQEWYPTEWQRRSGCGPTVSTTILLYQEPEKSEGFPVRTRGACRDAMENVWRFVTPGPGGIPSTQKLCKGLQAYAGAYGKTVRFHVLDIPRLRCHRPTLAQALAFLENALGNDRPVAFLNLHNGDEPALDAWHWVTVVSMDCEPDTGRAALGILDEGRCKTIDFSVWLRTSSLGGGLVWFEMH